MADGKSDKDKPFPSGDETFISSTAGDRRSFLPGDIIDQKYQLTSPLGRGGMGVVYACRHLELNQTYALKLLNGDQLSDEYWSRFQAEAKALARLNHPGIVRIHNMGIDGGQYPYYVMDLLSGETLELLLRKNGPLSPDQALEIFIQVAEALSSAHQQGIIHRDIKPANLMLVRDGSGQLSQTKIVDFGIARLSKHGFAAQSQTATGMVFGTPFYMSPEQCQGLRVDERSDIYSLGCTLFEVLIGRPPFCGDNAFHTFMMHQNEPPPSLKSVAAGKKFPEALEAALAKMLAKKPGDRYHSMAQVKQDLERLRAGKPILTAGLAATIPPGQNAVSQAVSQAITKRFDDRDNQDQGSEKGNQSAGRNFNPAIIGIIACLVFTVGGTGLYWLCSPKPKAPPTAVAGTPKETKPEISGHQEDMPDLDPLMDSNLTEFKKNEDRLVPMVNEYIENPENTGTPFKRNGPPAGFQFPRNFIIGAIQFGTATPIMATGFVQAHPGKPVCIYLSNYTDEWPEILDKFGPDDLDGLEIKIKDVPAVLKRIKRWHKLTKLCLFNSLVKALPRNESHYDESQIKMRDLPEIDKLKDLKCLGLCGPHLDGPHIQRMHLLDTVEELRLKRISNIDPLLETLTKKDNITTLWLGAEELTDKQLEPLTRMKNLRELRIRRSKLTPASLAYFKRMPSLGRLTLDTLWPTDALRTFKQELPAFESERTTDFKYWQMFPNQERDTYR